MQEENGAANGRDKADGKGTAPVPAPSDGAARERPGTSSRHGIAERLAADLGLPEVDPVRGLGTGTASRLKATTRMMNAYLGYLRDACGRDLDQLQEADVATLASMMASLEGLEVARPRRTYAS